MTLTNYGENAVQDKIHRDINFTVTTRFIALHVGNPGETGANEMTGGTYARQSATFSASAGGVTSNSAVITFTGLPAVAAPGVVAYSLCDAVTAGNFVETHWLSDQLPKPFVLTDTATDLFIAPAHGYANGDMVVLSAEIGTAVIPTGVVADTIYFVVSTAADTFQLSLTSGGAAIGITAKGSGTVQRVTPQTINAGGTLTFNASTISITAY